MSSLGLILNSCSGVRDVRRKTEELAGMPKIRELLRFLHRQGNEETRQAGSHHILRHPIWSTLSVPIHSGDIPRGLFLRILKDAGFSERDFFGCKSKDFKE
jgi:predicted RNA binding protein YcfA (HicA-like mRNA interferase family)